MSFYPPPPLPMGTVKPPLPQSYTYYQHGEQFQPIGNEKKPKKTRRGGKKRRQKRDNLTALNFPKNQIFGKFYNVSNEEKRMGMESTETVNPPLPPSYQYYQHGGQVQPIGNEKKPKKTRRGGKKHRQKKRQDTLTAFNFYKDQCFEEFEKVSNAEEGRVMESVQNNLTDFIRIRKLDGRGIADVCGSLAYDLNRLNLPISSKVILSTLVSITKSFYTANMDCETKRFNEKETPNLELIHFYVEKAFSVALPKLRLEHDPSRLEDVVAMLNILAETGAAFPGRTLAELKNSCGKSENSEVEKPSLVKLRKSIVIMPKLKPLTLEEILMGNDFNSTPNKEKLVAQAEFYSTKHCGNEDNIDSNVWSKWPLKSIRKELQGETNSSHQQTGRKAAKTPEGYTFKEDCSMIALSNPFCRKMFVDLSSISWKQGLWKGEDGLHLVFFSNGGEAKNLMKAFQRDEVLCECCN